MDLTPADALVRDETGERRIAVDLITPGAIIVVKPGEKLPLDGEVLAGSSSVNQAPVTGESLPVDKGPGDEVFAGTINGRGALDVRVTGTGATRRSPASFIWSSRPRRSAPRRRHSSSASRVSTRPPSSCWRWPSPSCRRCSVLAPGKPGSTARSSCWSCRARARS